MNKRIISLCLALALLLCLLPAAPTAAAAGDVAINETNFPDANFRRYVSENCDTNGDGVLSPTEISDVTEILCSQRGIASLKGIEFFTALKELHCSENQLTLLDVSKNTALEWLDCGGNQLTSLDVSGCTALTDLRCSFNQLTSLDVSGNAALTELYCYGNQLKSLDVSKNTALTTLSCGDNQLKSLDVSRKAALTVLSCGGNQLKSLDVSRNTALNGLNCETNQLKSLDVSRNTALEWLNCGVNQLTSLDVSKNTALTELYCSDDQLTSLDVSRNTALKELKCGDNQLTSLDVSKKNQALRFLACYGNKLAVLDVSAVPKLLDALENGEKTVNKAEGFVEYESEQGHIWMDLGQKTIPVTNCFSDVGSDDFFYDAVLWAYQNDITAGTSKTKFSPYKTCTREQVVTFLWRAKGCEEPTSTNNPFKEFRLTHTTPRPSSGRSRMGSRTARARRSSALAIPARADRS